MIYLVDENINQKTPHLLSTKDLNEENAKHLKALRPDVEERVAFLDLKGNACVYKVTGSKPLILDFEKVVHSPAAAHRTHLFIAPPVGAALEQAIEQATEIGYDFIHFVRAERVQYPKGKEVPVSRLRRIVQASCKQSGRLWAPVIDEEFYSFGKALIEAANEVMICADECVARASWGSLEDQLSFENKKDIAIFIGPEGGWSDFERQALHGASRIFSLGPHVLRVSTAVVSAYVLAWKELTHHG